METNLGCIGDYTTQLCGDCNKPLFMSNQYNIMSTGFERAHLLLLMAKILHHVIGSFVHYLQGLYIQDG